MDIRINSLAAMPLNSSNISHKGSVPASKLKNIPGNICACCGHETIKSTQISEMWANVASPLMKLLQKDHFYKIRVKFPDIYRVLSYFGKRYPKQSLAQTVKDDKNHCMFIDSVEDSLYKEPRYHRATDVDKEKMKKDRTMHILQISETELNPAAEIMDYVKPLSEYMHDYHKDIVNDFVTLSQKYPDKKLSEILKIPEVAEHYVEATYYDAMDFAAKRDFHWNNADKIVLENSPEAANSLNELRTEIFKLYGNITDPARFTYLVKGMYHDLAVKYDLFDFEDSIMDELSQMPTQLYTKNSFMSYVRRNYTDGAIITAIVSPFQESEEHVIPLSVGGKNDTYNKIVMCRQCNDRRAWYPYTEFLQYHPEMIENVHKQLHFYEEGILSGKITADLKYYPIEIAKSLLSCTNGRIDFDVSDYVQKIANNEIPLY